MFSLRDQRILVVGIRTGIRSHRLRERVPMPSTWIEYQCDAAERAVLTADTLRKRGHIFLEHEAADCPPVLIYDDEIVMDGRDMPYPSNYMLLRILPPEGIPVDSGRWPHIIIDPRAGHGPASAASFRRLPHPAGTGAVPVAAEAAATAHGHRTESKLDACRCI